MYRHNSTTGSSTSWRSRVGAWPRPTGSLRRARRAVGRTLRAIGLPHRPGDHRGAGGEKPLLAVPTADDVRSYRGRIAFFQHAGELFEFHGKLPQARGAQPPTRLLEMPVRRPPGRPQVVGRIQGRASARGAANWGSRAKATMALPWRFRGMSEYCGMPAPVAGSRCRPTTTDDGLGAELRGSR